MHWWATAIRGGTRRPTARSHGAFPPIPSSAHRHGATRLDSGPWSRVYDGRTFNEEALMSASSISPSLTISRLAERAGVGIDTVRYYERSEEHTSELQSLMRISYAVFCLKKKTTAHTNT